MKSQSDGIWEITFLPFSRTSPYFSVFGLPRLFKDFQEFSTLTIILDQWNLEAMTSRDNAFSHVSTHFFGISFLGDASRSSRKQCSLMATDIDDTLANTSVSSSCPHNFTYGSKSCVHDCEKTQILCQWT